MTNTQQAAFMSVLEDIRDTLRDIRGALEAHNTTPEVRAALQANADYVAPRMPDALADAVIDGRVASVSVQRRSGKRGGGRR